MKPDNSLSEKLTQQEAEDLLQNALDHGTKAIKAMIQVIWDEDGIDLEVCYRRESVIEQQYRQDENLPPLNLPSWEEVAPAKAPAA